jgi:LDH2 family malate/lactate/ureidoglycolate dehydrogenase
MSEVIVAESELLELAQRALAAGGVSEREAAMTARVLVLADMFGIHTHGISRIPQYLDRIKLGGINGKAEVKVTRAAPGLAIVDGDNGVGPAVGMHALQAAQDCARNAGIGAAFARGSNHFGPVMPYAFLAAQDGFASIIASNATTTIAPTGGRDTRVGNNPLGIGVPNPNGDPIILDIAMSVVARAKIRNLMQQDKPLPPGWAADRDGKPTTDAREALNGFLLPIAGHKGYGLAVMVDLLAGLLSGAAFLTHVEAWDKNPGAAQNLGHVFILIDAGKLGTSGWLGERMKDFIGILRETPPADPAAPVMTPGERELKAHAKAQRDGVSVGEKDFAAIAAGG